MKTWKLSTDFYKRQLQPQQSYTGDLHRKTDIPPDFNEKEKKS